MISPANSSDVLIVGGGPAGSTCAWRLRQRGVDVQILDRAAFPRDKVCAGWITPQVVDLLHLDIDQYAMGGVLQPIRSFRVGVLDNASRDSLQSAKKRRQTLGSTGSIQIDYEQPVSYGIRRCEFDEYLLRRCDAPAQEGISIRSIVRDGGEWLINGQFRSRLLVGAGGHFCPVARHLRSKCGVPLDQPVVVAQEAEFELDGNDADQCRIEPGVPELFFYPDMKGYAWCFRKENWLNIGLGREGEQHLSQWRDQLVHWLIDTGRIANSVDAPFKGHAYQLNTKIPQSVAGNGILLIGDSAGLADCHSGEGIRPAIESALLAADTIAEVENVADTAESYTRRIHQHFHDPAAGLPTFIPTSVRMWLARHMLRNKRFVRRVVLDDWFLNRNKTSSEELRSGIS